MNNAPIKTHLKNLSVFDTDFRDSIRPSNVFGLGTSYFSPQTRSATIKIKSSMSLEVSGRQGISEKAATEWSANWT